MTDTGLELLVNAVALPVVVRALLSTSRLRKNIWGKRVAISLVLWLDLVAVLWIECSVAGVVYFTALLCLTAAAASISLGEFGELLGRGRLPLYLGSVTTLAFLAYVHLPITTFLTSPGELDVHFNELVTTNARDAMIVVYVAAALYALATLPRLRTAMTLAILGVVSLALIYAYVLPFGYPVMSGLMFEQVPVSSAALVARGAVDAAAVAATALLVPILLRRVGARGAGVALTLVNLSLAAASGVSVYSEGVRTAVAGEDRSTAVAQPLVLSRDGPNVLILFLDRFMGGFVESLLQEDPTLTTRLAGFTWYPKTLAAGQNSISGVHPIFGGYDYMPLAMNARGMPLKEVSVEAYNILPRNFGRVGYDVHFVNPRGLGFTMEGDCSYLRGPAIHCSHVPMSLARDRAEEVGMPLRALSESNYGDLLVLLGSMRAAPYSLKAVLNQRGPWKPFMAHSAGTTFRQWAELDALPRLTATAASGKNFNVFWSILPHEPYFMGEDCRPRSSALALSEEEIVRRGHKSLFAVQHAIAARCTLQLVASYFDWMRRVGVYDQTLIIVVSDHGIVGPVEDRSSRAVAGGTTKNLFVRSRSLLMVKPRGSTGALQTSEEFLPNAEVPRIACEEIGGCTNPYLNDRPITAEERQKPFVVTQVPWQFNLQKRDAFVILGELQLTGGDPYDAKGWVELEPPE